MGRWFARFLLKEGKEVVISGRDRHKLLAAGKELGVKTVTSVEAVKGADVVLLCVSIDSFEEVVKEISPYVRPEQVVVDITSVKEAPVAIMNRYLKTEHILGTHPLFGPGARGVASQNFVLTPTVDAGRALAGKVKDYLEARDARVTFMGPREHDDMMAVVLGLAHFITIVAADTLSGLDELARLKSIGGSTYRVLLTLVESVISEAPELYATLQMELPHLTELEENFQKNAREWADLVKSKDRQGFVRRMTGVRERLEKGNPDFGKAYENMYRIMERL